MILDEKILITGSFNFTRAAEEVNAENLLIIRDSPGLLARYLENFKKEKAELAEEIARQTDSAVAGLIGNTAILYRFHPDASQRKIRLP